MQRYLFKINIRYNRLLRIMSIEPAVENAKLKIEMVVKYLFDKNDFHCWYYKYLYVLILLTGYYHIFIVLKMFRNYTLIAKFD